MVTTTTTGTWVHRRVEPNWLARLFDWKPFLIFVCLLPAVGLLLVFLTYPLGLGIWLAFTDTTVGRSGRWIGVENFQYLMEDRLFWQAVFYSVFYTAVATVGKFALGLWLALLLNNHIPFKTVLRAIILLPWITPTVLSAIAFWWIYDPQFSIISYVFVDVLAMETDLAVRAIVVGEGAPHRRPVLASVEAVTDDHAGMEVLHRHHQRARDRSSDRA